MSLLSEALRPAWAGVDAAGRMALAGLDALLAWRYTARRSGAFWRARWWIAPWATR
jgi:hypothetical protein